MTVTKLRIRLHQFGDSKLKRNLLKLRDKVTPHFLYSHENDYVAKVIEDQGKYFYQAKGITVQATPDECERAIVNPKLYYFSSALKLHFRLNAAKKFGLGLNWPIEAAAPINVCSLQGV
jgi:hypothetical protein